MQSILTKMRFKSLLSRGYFPSELPTPFTTKEFGEKSVEVSKKWNLKNIQKYWTSPETYSLPRYSHARRKLSIVNPVNQLLVSYLIAENWTALSEKLKESTITEFRPQIDILSDGRAVSGVDFEGVARRRVKLLSAYGRYIKTDIARFYPSVYTHSIAWALLGKTWVKQNMKTTFFKEHFSNKLDIAVRAGQQGQTIGIPIGPDTSRVISELVVTDVEKIISSSMPDFRERTVRYVDDLIVGLSEDEASQSLLSKISQGLYQYELELNAEKTQLFGVGCAHSPEWITFIRTFPLSRKRGRQRSDIDSYFDEVCHLADRNPRDNVLMFATKRAASFELRDENIAHFTRWMLYCARREPSCLSFVAEHFSALAQIGVDLPTDDIERFIFKALLINCKFMHTDEVAWLLFWAREIGLSLPDEVAQDLTSFRSSVVALLVLDLNQLGLMNSKPDMSGWRRFANASGLGSEMWLLIYEAAKKGWWPFRHSQSYVSEHEFFSDLWTQNVEFYDSAKRARLRVSPGPKRQGVTPSTTEPEYEGVGFEGYQGIL